MKKEIVKPNFNSPEEYKSWHSKLSVSDKKREMVRKQKVEAQYNTSSYKQTPAETRKYSKQAEMRKSNPFYGYSGGSKRQQYLQVAHDHGVNTDKIDKIRPWSKKGGSMSKEDYFKTYIKKNKK